MNCHIRPIGDELSYSTNCRWTAIFDQLAMNCHIRPIGDELPYSTNWRWTVIFEQLVMNCHIRPIGDELSYSNNLLCIWYHVGDVHSRHDVCSNNSSTYCNVSKPSIHWSMLSCTQSIFSPRIFSICLKTPHYRSNFLIVFECVYVGDKFINSSSLRYLDTHHNILDLHSQA